MMRGHAGKRHRAGRPGPAVRSWLAAKLALDGNPLRRRTDRVEAWIMCGLLAAFLIAAPLAAIAAGHWTDRAGVKEQRAQRSWHQTDAVLLRSAPRDLVLAYGHPWLSGKALARWHGPGRRVHVGAVTAPLGAAAGATVRIWVNASGAAVGHPLRSEQLLLRVAAVAALVVVALALVVLGLAHAARLLLDRNRLKQWEAGWACVGPQWTRRL
jgi:hypothetical protein